MNLRDSEPKPSCPGKIDYSVALALEAAGSSVGILGPVTAIPRTYCLTCERSSKMPSTPGSNSMQGNTYDWYPKWRGRAVNSNVLGVDVGRS